MFTFYLWLYLFKGKIMKNYFFSVTGLDIIRSPWKHITEILSKQHFMTYDQHGNKRPEYCNNPRCWNAPFHPNRNVRVIVNFSDSRKCAPFYSNVSYDSANPFYRSNDINKLSCMQFLKWNPGSSKERRRTSYLSDSTTVTKAGSICWTVERPLGRPWTKSKTVLLGNPCSLF